MCNEVSGDNNEEVKTVVSEVRVNGEPAKCASCHHGLDRNSLCDILSALIDKSTKKGKTTLRIEIEFENN